MVLHAFWKSTDESQISLFFSLLSNSSTNMSFTPVIWIFICMRSSKSDGLLAFCFLLQQWSVHVLKSKYSRICERTVPIRACRERDQRTTSPCPGHKAPSCRCTWGFRGHVLAGCWETSGPGRTGCSFGRACWSAKIKSPKSYVKSKHIIYILCTTYWKMTEGDT